MSNDALTARPTTTAVTAGSRRADPTLDGLMRFGAVCGVLFGLSLGVPGVIEAFTGETTVTSYIVGLGVAAFAVPALFAFHLHQAEVAGRFGAAAFAVGVIGLGLFAAGTFNSNLTLFFLDESISEALLDGPTRWAILSVGVAFIVGTVLFGASMVRSGVLPRVPAVGYTAAVITIALLSSVGDSLLSSAVHVLACVSLVWLSVSVWRAHLPR
jgi:hypothetical protein